MSNLPTVWSNALVGVALASGSGPLSWTNWGLVAAMCSLLYVGGMIHNDVMDAAVDARERPDRPLPSGRISRTQASVAAAMLFLAGVHGLWLAGPWPMLLAALLALVIMAYNALHRHAGSSVVLLGVCRAMVYGIGAAAVTWPVDLNRLLPPAVALGLYVIGLSILARDEGQRPQRIKRVVLLICAISVLDAAILVILGQPAAAGVAILCFVLAAWMQRRILGS